MRRSSARRRSSEASIVKVGAVKKRICSEAEDAADSRSFLGNGGVRSVNPVAPMRYILVRTLAIRIAQRDLLHIGPVLGACSMRRTYREKLLPG